MFNEYASDLTDDERDNLPHDPMFDRIPFHEVEVRIMKHADILACPHVILVPYHYRQDGTCRCSDPSHVEMSEWGYTWDGKSWG